MLGETGVPGSGGGAEALAASGGSLLQVGGQGQKVLGFNLLQVISASSQPELGVSVGVLPSS